MVTRGLGLKGKQELNVETVEEDECVSWGLAFPNHQMLEEIIDFTRRHLIELGPKEQLFTSGNRTGG